jgi:hypothetical protein
MHGEVGPNCRDPLQINLLRFEISQFDAPKLLFHNRLDGGPGQGTPALP